MSEKNENYCLGFVIAENSVVLIQRQKPEWQKDKWNGVGGHIEEGETAKKAMERECLEETGHLIPEENWKYFCLLQGTTPEGKTFSLHCFTSEVTTYEILKFRFDTPLVEEGPVSLFSTNLLPDTLDNVPWLIAMAKESLKNNNMYTIRLLKSVK